MATELSAFSLFSISKSFGSLEVLRDISFDIKSGEIISLLGASGCGKSTLLNILSGLLQPDSGALKLYNVDASQFKDWNKIAYMFQEDRLLPWRRVIKNVEFGLEAENMARPERRERAQAALKQVGLEEFEHAWPSQLSGGMRSRVALARSLVVEPTILLMDEPFSKLDPQTRAHMHTELQRLQKLYGMTIVIVTHDVEEAVVLSDRIVVFEPRPGRVRRIKTLDLPRPRISTNVTVAEQIRQLRLEV